jgi:predicted acyltransferase
MEKPGRIESIDQFRGLAIVLMVLANFLAGVAAVPAWLKHAPDIGLTVIDLIAPFFIFAIGLTYGLSVRSRLKRDGAGKMYGHFVTRWLAIIGIGSLLSAGEIWVGENTTGVSWGVLQAIGMAGLATLALIRLPAWARAVIGLVLLGAYQWLLDHFWRAIVLGSPHGGLLGSMDWLAMLLLASVLADVFFTYRDQKSWVYPALSFLTLLVGIGLAVITPISKNRVSSSYVLVSLGISAVLFFLFTLLVDRMHIKVPLLSVWGKNPLLLYLLHNLLLGLFFLPDIPIWYRQAPLWLAGVQAIFLLAALSWIGLNLNRRGWILSI